MIYCLQEINQVPAFRLFMRPEMNTGISLELAQVSGLSGNPIFQKKK